MTSWLLFAGLLLSFTLNQLAQGGVLNEEFATDPAAHGWRIVGDPTLFRWNRENQNLAVTWDSSRSNSFFCRSVGTILTKTDDFSLAFELKLEEIRIGLRPEKPFTFQLAVGFLNLQSAVTPQFLRGTGTQSPNLVELNYFPDSGFGATISPTLTSTNGRFASSFSFPLELTPGDLFRIAMRYHGASQTLTTTVTRNGEAFGPIKDVQLPMGFTDFRVDTVAISSYSDTGAEGSILARGSVDNLTVVTPDGPVLGLIGGFTGSRWQVQFEGQTGWAYTLERTVDFQSWISVSPPVAGTGQRQTVLDESPPSPAAFYRVKAERP